MKAKKVAGWGCGTVLAAFVFLFALGSYLQKRHPRRASAVVPSATASMASKESLYDRAVAREQRDRERDRCVLSLTSSRVADVPVFPSESGLDEFSSAQGNGDTEAAAVAASANGAFLVSGSTRCAFLDYGLRRSRVRVLEGPHQGRAGWVPSEWTRGVK